MKLLVITLSLAAVAVCWGDSITHGGTTINMDFVDIGYANNDAQSAANRAHAQSGGDGYGAVGYNYRMGKFEVTAAQWASVISADSNVGNAGTWSGSQPTASSSWYESAKFANWLTSGNAYSGAYQFNGSGTLTNVNRAAAVAAYGTVYVLPTEDEWYKAAYLKSDGSGYTLYATGDSIPSAGAGGENYANVLGSPWNIGTGIVENNGTFDMNGNVREWIESAADGTLDIMGETRVDRGGAYAAVAGSLSSEFRQAGASIGDPSGQSSLRGFRVAAIPEPSTLAFIGVFGGGLWFVRRYFPSV